MNRIDEKELKKLITELKSSNNKEAFETLYQKYNKLVYRIAFTILKNKEDSEDIVQSVFAKIYSLTKDKLPINSIATWIYSVTKNEAISLYRKRKNTVDLDCMYEIADTDNEINRIIDQDTYNRIINRLDDKEKEIVSLKILTNLTFGEIAKLLDEPTGTVKWRYYKSIHTLKLLLSNLGMFIITLVIGLKLMFVPKNKAQNGLNNMIENENSNNQEKNQSNTKSTPQTNNSSNWKNENQEQTKEEIQISTNEPINIESIGILTASSFFLVFTIIFLINYIKHQLKQKVKTSK